MDPYAFLGESNKSSVFEDIDKILSELQGEILASRFQIDFTADP